MIANETKHTSPRQRIVVVVIAGFLLLSTFALYASVVISASGSTVSSTTKDPRDNLSEEEKKRFDELYAEYNNQQIAQAKELSSKYFNSFVTYKDRVKAFNNAEVTTLKTEDIVVGNGAEVNSLEFDDYSAYYIGWRTDSEKGEVIFDSSFDDAAKPSSLISPLPGSTGMIQGWIEGIQGMKIGGVREITMPALMGYGDKQQGDIPANSPLKFVVMLIPKVEEVKLNEELEKLYMKMYGMGA